MINTHLSVTPNLTLFNPGPPTDYSASDVFELRARLAEYGQEHVLQFWEELAETEQEALLQQIEAIDLDLIARLSTQQHSGETWSCDDNIQPPEAFRLTEQASDVRTVQQARQVGEAILTAGVLGVVIVAGGQGTRLGFEQPKGMYPIGPISNSHLLQILLEKVVALRQRYASNFPVYIMTSPATHEATVEFLNQSERFGIPEEDLIVFCQGVMPTVDADGKLMLAEKGRISTSPDGHGGIVAAMNRHGLIEDMNRRGVQHLFYSQVDNPIVPIVDPVFLGMHVLRNSDITSAAITKNDPTEKVGNVVLVDGRTQIIEYSDLPDEVAEQRDETGGLKLWAGNAAIHMISVPFLETTLESLPFHVAHKKVPFINSAGDEVAATEPNAYKFERFIFDLLPAARRSFVYEVRESEWFGPLKNAPGAIAHSPECVREQMCAVFRKWLRDAHVEVEDEVKIEISPLWANSREEVIEKMKPGTRLTRDTYLR